MRGVDTVAVLLERCPRRVERLRRPAKIARGERDFGLGDDASRARDGLVRTKGTRRASQERLRSYQIAELCHRDAAQRQRRRIVAQRHAFECAERITRGERMRRGRDYRVHRNPATLVTPTVRFPPTRLSHDQQPVGGRAWRRPHEGASNAEYQTVESASKKHVTATREEWLAQRLDLLEAEKELTRRSDELASGDRHCRGSGSTRRIDSTPTKATSRWRTSSRGARSSSSTTSCSDQITRRAVRRARRLRMASTASRSISRTTTSCCRRYHWRRSRSSRRTSGAWGGRFPGRRRSAPTSTSTSTYR